MGERQAVRERDPVHAVPVAVRVWNAYAGGFLLGARGACVPLVFQVGRERQVVRFGIRVRCDGEP